MIVAKVSWDLKFVKKTSMPNPIKKASDISWVVPDLLKALATLLDTTVIRSVVDQEDIKPYWKSEKRLYKNVTFFLISSTVLGINNPIIYKFFKDFTNHKKKTNRVVLFSCRPFLNIFKYRDHQWNLPTIWKTRLLQMLTGEFS